jgi:hypothetical protein
MWEVRAADDQLDELISWVLRRVAADVQVYRSAAGEQRLVVIDPSGRARTTLAGAPAHLVARPPHAWDFDPVQVAGPVVATDGPGQSIG